MNFFSNAQETVSRYRDYIDDLRDVFRCNDVDFGAPDDFFAFARTLKYHSELRGDLLRVVKCVMDSGTNVSFRTILTVIAVASGGPEVTTSEREMSVPVKMVIESLIGAGAWSQPSADHPDVYLKVKGTEQTPASESKGLGGGEAVEVREKDPEENAAVPILAPQESAIGGVETVEYAEVSGRADVGGGSFEKVADDSSVDSSADSSIDEGLPGSRNGYDGPSSERQGLLKDFGGSNTLAEATLAESLSRLDLNSLQLKVYLDSIDQRISRMEPRLENVAAVVRSTPPTVAREEPAMARFSAAIVSESVANSPDKDSQASGNDANGQNQQGGAAIASSAATGPLAVSAPAGTDSRPFKFDRVHSGRRQIAVPIFVGVAMLLLAASLVWRFGRDTRPVVILPVNGPVDGGGNVAGAGAPRAAPSVGVPHAATAGAPHVASAGEASVPVSGEQGESSARGYAGQGDGRAAAEKPAVSSKRSAQIPLRSPLRTSSSVAAPMMAKGTAEVADPSDNASDDAEDVGSVPLSNRPVDVSSGVMAANLLSAPKPSYPTLASLMRTQGSVVMQAVISKDGTVEEVHVIKGHRLLRGAAKNAVRNWRYRPYKVDGVPVDVATTVSVDFNLHH
jgi:TonB family protein